MYTSNINFDSDRLKMDQAVIKSIHTICYRENTYFYLFEALPVHTYIFITRG